MSMRSEVFAGAWYGMEITLDEKLIEKNTEVFSRLESEMRNYVKRYGLDYIPQKNKIFIKGNEETEFSMALTMLAGTRSLIPFTDKFVFYDFTEDGSPMDARKSYREWIASLINEQPINDDNRSENDMKRMNNKIYLTAALCTALLFTVSCGKVEKADDAVITESTTVVTSIEAPSPDDDESAVTVEFEGEEKTGTDKKSETDSETAPEEIADITDDRKSETKETTTETEDSEIEDTTETAETTAEKATTTSKAVTSAATTNKKATTTTKAVAQTTTTTKKAATTTTTAKQATTTTTTTKTTTTTTQAASSVEWTPLLLAYRHYNEATIEIMDDMDLTDMSKITSAELEMIRKDICDYGLKNFNGKQVVTLWTANGTKTIDFLRPLELTVDTTLSCYIQGSWVLGDAHLDCVTGSWSEWVGSKAYNKMSEEEKYQLAVKGRQNCLQGMENALYRWYDYLDGNGHAYGAYQMTYNWGYISNGGSFWLLTK